MVDFLLYEPRITNRGLLNPLDIDPDGHTVAIRPHRFRIADQYPLRHLGACALQTALYYPGSLCCQLFELRFAQRQIVDHFLP